MEYSIDNLMSNALAKSSSSEKVERVVVFILESANKTDSEHTMSTDEIKKAYKKLKKKSNEYHEELKKLYN